VEALGPETKSTDLLLVRGAGSLEDDAPFSVKVVGTMPVLVLLESTGNVSGGSAALPFRDRGLRIADPTGTTFVFSSPRVAMVGGSRSRTRRRRSPCRA
jgi:hypothetical protein